MSDSASHSTSGLPPDDRRLPQPDLYLKIATQIKSFFDATAIVPLAIEGRILRIEVQVSHLEPFSHGKQQLAKLIGRIVTVDLRWRGSGLWMW